LDYWFSIFVIGALGARLGYEKDVVDYGAFITINKSSIELCEKDEF